VRSDNVAAVLPVDTCTTESGGGCVHAEAMSYVECHFFGFFEKARMRCVVSQPSTYGGKRCGLYESVRVYEYVDVYTYVYVYVCVCVIVCLRAGVYFCESE